MPTTNFHYWLSKHFGSSNFTLVPLAGDASLRRYFRVQQSKKTWIAMDASAEIDKCPQFIAIADALREKGLITPEIVARDLLSGYLLLTDFGDDLFLKKVNSDNAEELYERAVDALVVLASIKEVKDYDLPLFTAEFMRQELGWFQEWFLEKHLGLDLSSSKAELSSCFDLIATSCGQQPQRFMHRDYHSANLMILPDKRVGILDFQDAYIGPVTYDLVSILRDCYIDWPNDFVIKRALEFRKKMSITVSETEFLRWFDWMGMQRHLKALMTFSRKYRRDFNPNYLKHIPRTLNYVMCVSQRYPELAVLHSFLLDQIPLEQIACVP